MCSWPLPPAPEEQEANVAAALAQAVRIGETLQARIDAAIDYIGTVALMVDSASVIAILRGKVERP